MAVTRSASTTADASQGPVAATFALRSKSST
jgi:hypothetical protein